MGESENLDLNSIIEILNYVSKGADVLVNYLRSKPYGIVHKSEPIVYMGKKGRLVWDYIIWNELTFEDIGTGEKYSLVNRLSDEEMEKKFNELVIKYGE
jgi:hypothetical protein